MNIDFSTHPGFSAYVLLLILSGVVVLALGGSPVLGRRSPRLRILNLLFGVAFLGYGIYLAFIFNGGHYLIFFQAFIVPALLIARSVIALTGQRRRGGAVMTPGAIPYGQPTPYAQPTAYAQPTPYAQPTAYGQPTAYPAAPNGYADPGQFASPGQFSPPGSMTAPPPAPEPPSVPFNP